MNIHIPPWIILIFFSVPLWAQKGGVEGLPTLSETYEYYSIFELKEGQYQHKETHNVWAPTFVRINPKKNEVILPGIGNEQKCFYVMDSCVFLKNEEIIQTAIIPIECVAVGGTPEKSDLRLHYVAKKRKVIYIFSLGIAESNDRILMHNFHYQELAELMTNNEIRFQ